MLTKRQAIIETRKLADAVIEQLERKANGWDKGIYRDDDTTRQTGWRTVMHYNVQDAFRLSYEFS